MYHVQDWNINVTSSSRNGRREETKIEQFLSIEKKLWRYDEDSLNWQFSPTSLQSRPTPPGLQDRSKTLLQGLEICRCCSCCLFCPRAIKFYSPYLLQVRKASRENAEFAHKLQIEMEKRMTLNSSFPANTNGAFLVIVDRGLDLKTPLMHDLAFQVNIILYCPREIVLSGFSIRLRLSAFGLWCAVG